MKEGSALLAAETAAKPRLAADTRRLMPLGVEVDEVLLAAEKGGKPRSAGGLERAQKRSARKWKLALLAAECRLHSADSVVARPGGPAAQSKSSELCNVSFRRGGNPGELAVLLLPLKMVCNREVALNSNAERA
jgi:hypothetical protein